MKMARSHQPRNANCVVAYCYECVTAKW